MRSPRTTPEQPVRGRASERARSQVAEFCDLCGERNPIEPDAYPPTGMWICVPCLEETLQGACHDVG